MQPDPRVLPARHLTSPTIRAAATVFGLCVAACAPRQDPFHPDQAPDVNYDLTAIKDQKYLGAIPAIDDFVQAEMLGKFPGCTIGVVHQGQIAYLRAYGIADFRIQGNPFDDVPFTRQTVCGIGSVSKVATAIAVMKLAELGHVNLDAAASTYFPHWTPRRRPSCWTCCGATARPGPLGC
jgi:CubicO group peptidase (beta-lactamase class C family)